MKQAPPRAIRLGELRNALRRLWIKPVSIDGADSPTLQGFPLGGFINGVNQRAPTVGSQPSQIVIINSLDREGNADQVARRIPVFVPIIGMFPRFVQGQDDAVEAQPTSHYVFRFVVDLGDDPGYTTCLFYLEESLNPVHFHVGDYPSIRVSVTPPAEIIQIHALVTRNFLENLVTGYTSLATAHCDPVLIPVMHPDKNRIRGPGEVGLEESMASGITPVERRYPVRILATSTVGDQANLPEQRAITPTYPYGKELAPSPNEYNHAKHDQQTKQHAPPISRHWL